MAWNLPTMDEVNATRRAVPTLPIACLHCGNPFKKKNCPSRNLKYCSRACRSKAFAGRRAKPRAICKNCGKEAPNQRQSSCSAKCAYRLRKLKTRPPRICPVCIREYFHKGNLRLKFCSVRCQRVQQAATAYETFECSQCGQSCRRRKVRTRPTAHKFCGAACAQTFNVGPNNSFWRGGSDPNRGAQWTKLAESIRQRDGFTCKRCGRAQAENKQKLSVDHIRPWRSFADEQKANDPSNLVSLCRSCHTKKTVGAERAWLKGDVLAMDQYIQSIRLETAVRNES